MENATFILVILGILLVSVLLLLMLLIYKINARGESIPIFMDRIKESISGQERRGEALQNILLQSIQSGSLVNENKLENIRLLIDSKISQLSNVNKEQLEEIKFLVDEKLYSTLEKRLGDSFQLISDRLEAVYRGLGEMQSIASSVGDLKKVLSNVKTRGIWGEMQLGNILAQIMSPNQYMQNVAIRNTSQDRVEYAIKLPGKSNDPLSYIYLPIDAKFPLADYQRLIEAQDNDNPGEVETQYKLLEISIKKSAKLIAEKYIYPPITTDFAIMFLPIEGLYAEVLRNPGLVELLQQRYRVTITSPTTLSAFLNSLQMGFKTLAIERRSSEVWNTLSIIKREFTKFADILSKTRIKLEQAGNAISEAEGKSKTIRDKLRDIHIDPPTEEPPLEDKNYSSQVKEDISRI